ncbi:MAG: hypothetical protein H6540_07220 [Bacteroidales bacterium]|nr:hypothetical protein [Bacteroidales bacterium]
MKKLIICLVLPLMFPSLLKAQFTVGSFPADFASIGEAFTFINTAGSDLGDIVLEITDNIIEPSTAVLYESGHDPFTSYNSVTIYPSASGVTLSGNFNAPLIELNGASNVIIDGRVNQTGNADLQLINQNTGTNASTIKFIESANPIKLNLYHYGWVLLVPAPCNFIFHIYSELK